LLFVHAEDERARDSREDHGDGDNEDDADHCQYC
jgi:hypothetical protein